jgi:hypothetical protein
MSNYTMKLAALEENGTKRETPAIGTVIYDRVASFRSLAGMTLRCTTGSLWFTLENDLMDHVLLPGQTYNIPAAGKVVIGGKGTYRIEKNAPLAMAS